MNTFSKKTEQALLIDLKRGMPEAVRVWYARYKPIIKSFVQTKIDKREDVEEITREIFMNCLHHLPVFRGEASIKTWMTRIASHEIADYYRKKYAKKVITAIPLSQLLFVDTPKNMHETAAMVQETLTTLRRDYQELLLLKYVDKKSINEISQLLNKSIKSVESDLFRARKEFRAVYMIVTDQHTLAKNAS